MGLTIFLLLQRNPVPEYGRRHRLIVELIVGVWLYFSAVPSAKTPESVYISAPCVCWDIFSPLIFQNRSGRTVRPCFLRLPVACYSLTEVRNFATRMQTSAGACDDYGGIGHESCDVVISGEDGGGGGGGRSVGGPGWPLELCTQPQWMLFVPLNNIIWFKCLLKKSELSIWSKYNTFPNFFSIILYTTYT